MIRNEIKKNKILLICLIIVSLLGLALLVIEKRSAIPFFSKSISEEDKSAKTTSTLPSAQSDFSGGTPRSIKTDNKTEGTVTDNKGSISTVPPESQWSRSRNGAITIYAPTNGSLLRDGDVLNGTTTISGSVTFRLNDNVSGMIATGMLNVVNGKFSGKFDFSTNASEGQVDVFTQADDGTESNHVSIPVRFQ